MILDQLRKSHQDTVRKVRDGLEDLRRKIATNEQAAQALEAAGLTYAGIWMKDGKYMYLVYPAGDDGTRRRQYVGAGTAEQQAALEAIERGKRYDRIQETIKALHGRIKSADYFLQRALFAMEDQKW